MYFKIRKKLMLAIILLFATNVLIISLPDHQNESCRRVRPERINVVAGLRDSEVKQFVHDLIAFYYQKRNISEELVGKIISKLAENATDDELAAKKVYVEVIYPKDPNSAIAKAYNNPQYRTEEAPNLMFSILNRFNDKWGGRIVDVGCGNNALAYVISKNIKEAYEVIGTDIIDYSVKKDDPKVKFLLQTKEDDVPLPDESIDTIIMVYMLHHMPTQTREALLGNIYKKLKPGGRIVIVEDTFSDIIPPQYPGKLIGDFLMLNPQQRQAVFSFIDWYNNRLIKDMPEMHLAYTFASMENWEDIFKKAGFKVNRKEFLGVADLAFSPKLPMGIFVLEK